LNYKIPSQIKANLPEGTKLVQYHVNFLGRQSENLTRAWAFAMAQGVEDKVKTALFEGAQKDRLDWDIAFCGYRIRTNSGTSGKGKGAAIDLGYGEYDKWKTVSQLPSNPNWIVDDSTVTITMSRNDWNKHLITNHLDFG